MRKYIDKKNVLKSWQLCGIQNTFAHHIGILRAIQKTIIFFYKIIFGVIQRLL